MAIQVEEFLLTLIEYPIYSILVWATICWYSSNGVIGFLLWTLFTPVFLLALLMLYLFAGSRLSAGDNKIEPKYADWIQINDPELKGPWKGKKIPMREAYEWYLLDKIEFTEPLLKIFLHRYDLFQFIFTQGHLQELVWGVLGKGVFKHNTAGDHDDIAPVYNLGNEFYHSFLGDPMFYSSGIAYDSSDTLEVAQARKTGVCAELLQLKDGDRILDFGCGWCSWLIYCAKNFDVQCTGLTISTEQFKYCQERIKKEGLEDKITVVLTDYRDLTVEKYGKFNKISNFEMSEHVGIRNYQAYMAQVRSLLEDDGLFFLQIAGLRRWWQYEDLIWGNFMGKYIFPGADASCPLAWDVSQLERGGFEVQTVRNQGVHYAHTIEMWYHNLVKNKDMVINKWGRAAYRLHEVFLAWSTMVARQGSSTVWCIVLTHHHGVDAYSVPNATHKLNKTEMFCKKERYTTAH
jgi:sphingolipid C9-methyltransferase